MSSAAVTAERAFGPEPDRRNVSRRVRQTFTALGAAGIAAFGIYHFTGSAPAPSHEGPQGTQPGAAPKNLSLNRIQSLLNARVGREVPVTLDIGSVIVTNGQAPASKDSNYDVSNVLANPLRVNDGEDVQAILNGDQVTFHPFKPLKDDTVGGTVNTAISVQPFPGAKGHYYIEVQPAPGITTGGYAANTNSVSDLNNFPGLLGNDNTTSGDTISSHSVNIVNLHSHDVSVHN